MSPRLINFYFSDDGVWSYHYLHIKGGKRNKIRFINEFRAAYFIIHKRKGR